MAGWGAADRTDYTLPPGCTDTEILRVVVRESMSADLLDMLICDIMSTTETIIESTGTDLECYSRPQAPRIEKFVQSMGRSGWKEKSHEIFKRYMGEDKDSKGVFHATC